MDKFQSGSEVQGQECHLVGDIRTGYKWIPESKDCLGKGDWMKGVTCVGPLVIDTVDDLKTSFLTACTLAFFFYKSYKA